MKNIRISISASDARLLDRSLVFFTPPPVFTHLVINKSTNRARLVRSEDEAITLAQVLASRGHGVSVELTDEGEVEAYLETTVSSR